MNQKQCVREMLDRPTRAPRSLQIWRSVPGASGTPSGNVARPLHGNQASSHVNLHYKVRRPCCQLRVLQTAAHSTINQMHKRPSSAV